MPKPCSLTPATKDIYIITKREPNHTHLYRLPYPQNRDEVITAEAFGEMPSFGQGPARLRNRCRHLA